MPSEIVTLKDGQPVTTSMIVAEVFGKQHGHVLRDIDSIISSKPYQSRIADGTKSNFGFCYQTNKLANNKPLRYCEMDRQGFEILAMGFTGEKALEWKLKYSDAFAMMEAELRRQSNNTPSPYAALSSHTVRSVQIGYSKSVNTALIDHGGRNAIVSYNLKNCTVQSGRLPQEWKALGKQEGLPSKSRNSAKDVLRVKAPQVACGMSLADQLVSGGAKPDDGISIGKDSQPLFQRILALGITPPELLL